MPKRKPTEAQLAALAGGRGTGAGGRPRNEVRRVKRMVVFDPELLAEIDAVAENRSAWLEEAAREKLERKSRVKLPPVEPEHLQGEGAAS